MCPPFPQYKNVLNVHQRAGLCHCTPFSYRGGIAGNHWDTQDHCHGRRSTSQANTNSSRTAIWRRETLKPIHCATIGRGGLGALLYCHLRLPFYPPIQKKDRRCRVISPQLDMNLCCGPITGSKISLSSSLM